MTKRKSTENGPSELELNLYRLRWISFELESGAALSTEARAFLATSLNEIGEGADANEVLGVKAKRGQRRSRDSATKSFKIDLAMAWIAAAIKPCGDGGLGLDLDEACQRASKKRQGEADFGLSEDSLKTYWNTYPEKRNFPFAAPLYVFPLKRAKT